MIFRSLLPLLLVALLSGLPGGSVEAQSASDPLEIDRLKGEITLDGVPDEEAWNDLDSFPLTTYVPDAGNEPSERSDIRIGYTDDHLYVGAWLYDSRPDGIRVNSYQRDDMSTGNDIFGIVLDTFNNNENALSFFTTPAGIRTDFTVLNDAEGRPPFNADWNTFWDVETRQNEKGWTVEMRIPFSSLRYQVDNGRVTMGINILRWIARKSESAVYPAIPNNWGFYGQFKPSRGRDVVFRGMQSRKPLQITPYVLGGASQQHMLNEERTEYIRRDDFTYDIGGDIKVGLSSNFTLDLTVNTDFAQVEADNQQVNLTRFSLFFPEKRKFFQERASLFNFSLGSRSRLFYSRRIGISGGRQIPILGGLRLTGTSGEWDVGLINMQTGASGEVPTENFGVFRVRRKVFNPNSYAGGMFTSRIDGEGGYNYAYGLDGVIHLGGQDYLSYNLAQTLGSEGEISPLSMDPTFIRARWETRKIEGFGYSLGYARSGNRFNPKSGFLTRSDYTRIGDHLFYGWFADDSSPVQNYRVSIRANGYLRNSDGSVESSTLGSRLNVNYNSGASLSVSPSLNYEHLLREFELPGGIPVLPGEYYNYTLGLGYQTSSSHDVSGSAFVDIGEFYDGRRWTGRVSPSWSVSSHLNVGSYYQVTHLNFSGRGRSFTAHIARLRLRYYFNTELSVSTFVQFSNAAERVTSNFRLRYNPREGNDLYLVYNEGLNTDRQSYSPARPLSNRRTILVKYTYTFNY